MLGDLFPSPTVPDMARCVVDLLPGGGVTVHDDYGYNPWHPRPGAGRDEVFIGQLLDGVGVVFDGLGNFTQQNLPGALGVPTESVACSATPTSAQGTTAPGPSLMTLAQCTTTLAWRPNTCIIRLRSSESAPPPWL